MSATAPGMEVVDCSVSHRGGSQGSEKPAHIVRVTRLERVRGVDIGPHATARWCKNHILSITTAASVLTWEMHKTSKMTQPSPEHNG